MIDPPVITNVQWEEFSLHLLVFFFFFSFCDFVGVDVSVFVSFFTCIILGPPTIPTSSYVTILLGYLSLSLFSIKILGWLYTHCYTLVNLPPYPSIQRTRKKKKNCFCSVQSLSLCYSVSFSIFSLCVLKYCLDLIILQWTFWFPFQSKGKLKHLHFCPCGGVRIKTKIL